MLDNSPRILIIEDEWAITDLIDEIVGDLGYTVSGTAHSLPTARDEISKRNFDAVLLDIGLQGRHDPEIADRLKEAETPFAFVTGYGHPFERRHIDVPLLRKPFTIFQLRSTLEELVGPPSVRAAEKG